MTVGSLFSGIGGLELGLEWAGFETKWFCEIEPYAQQVLARHWPDVPIIPDIRDVTAETVPRVDVITGGFPCQDISWAGKGRGIDYDLSEQDGTRSGLWWEMWRVIRDLRPRYVIAENVPALTHRGLDIVLGSLAEIGYDAEWTTISAASVGAPHIRERIFIVAYPRQPRLEGYSGDGERGHEPGRLETQPHRPVSAGGLRPDWFGGGWQQPWPVSFRPVADAHGVPELVRDGSDEKGSGEAAPAGPVDALNQGGRVGELERVAFVGDVRGVAHGLPLRVDPDGWLVTDVPDRTARLKALGNAVVPQVAYLVARAVMKHAQEASP